MIRREERENFEGEEVLRGRGRVSRERETDTLRSSHTTASQLLLHEMIARVVKITLRERLRCRMQLVSTPSEKPFKLEVCYPSLSPPRLFLLFSIIIYSFVFVIFSYISVIDFGVLQSCIGPKT